MEQVNCVICGHENSLPLFSSKSFMFKDEEFTLSKCANCALVFLNPRPGLEEIGKYYQNYHLHIDILKLDRFSKQVLLYETVGHTKYNRGFKKKFLEIGFGDGLFLEYMKNKEWDVYGIEIGEDCVNRLKKMEIENVFNGDIFSHPFNSGYFDLVRMNQTLEHMHNPVKVLTEVKRILKKNGKVVISVPNFAGGCHRLFKQYAYPLHLPFHLYFFTLSTLESLVNKVGGVRIINVYKNHFFVSYLASIVQFVKRNQKDNPLSYDFSTSKIVIHRLIGLFATPFMSALSLFVEGDNLEIEVEKI